MVGTLFLACVVGSSPTGNIFFHFFFTFFKLLFLFLFFLGSNKQSELDELTWLVAACSVLDELAAAATG